MRLWSLSMPLNYAPSDAKLCSRRAVQPCIYTILTHQSLCKTILKLQCGENDRVPCGSRSPQTWNELQMNCRVFAVGYLYCFSPMGVDWWCGSSVGHFVHPHIWGDKWWDIDDRHVLRRRASGLSSASTPLRLMKWLHQFFISHDVHGHISSKSEVDMYVVRGDPMSKAECDYLQLVDTRHQPTPLFA